ncbi:hypothetical protein [Rubritalea sp.]|uniref:hypothetical protein n=1 Tax=Rubritalea sp. TaxID=2109375 RepID=UPI003EF3BC34
MTDHSPAIQLLTKRLRKSFNSYAKSHRFRIYVKRSINKKLLKWWSPSNLAALQIIINKQRQKATTVADSGVPMLGVVLMRNSILQNPKETGSALALGSTDFTPEGLNQLNQFADRINGSRHKEDDQSDFKQYIDSVFSDENYTESRRRIVPPQYSKGNSIFFLDVMMRGDDALKKVNPLPSLYPLIILLGTEGKSTHCEVMPKKIGALGLSSLKKGTVWKWLPTPSYMTMPAKVFLYALIAYVLWIIFIH